MRVVLALAAALVLGDAPAVALDLARDGQALLPIRVRAEADAAELFAARELADYLGRITGAAFRIEPGPGPAPSIEVAHDPRSHEPEAWSIRTDGERLRLTGGAPRGTLYAVYRFLEDVLGVRWWTPWDETVPRRKNLSVGKLDRRGAPVFGYRDIFGVRAAPEFHARNRLNGHYSELDESRGGSIRFGPPFHTHTFDRRVPVAEYFEDHPEFFSEIDGFRYGGETQWCLTNEALLDVVEREVRESITVGEATARERGLSAPRYYDVSQNDWAHPCTCGRCAVVSAEEGSQAGPIVRFVDRLADRIVADHPQLKITTLAYQYSTQPPLRTRADDGVIVRFTALFQQDFAKPLSAPANALVRREIEGWQDRAEHLQVWDYRVTFHADGDLPRADHAFLGDDFRFYAEHGVEGIFVQTEFADVADMRDLEVWLTAKLLEDPYRDARALTRAFLRGYYGPAARPIARYLRALERRVAKSPARLGSSPPADAFRWLDPYFVRWAQARFDDAERRVASDPELLARVRGARVALDRATLARWDGLGLRMSREAVIRRYEATRLARIEQRLDGALKELAQLDLAAEVGRTERDE